MSVSRGSSRCPGWLRLTALGLAAFAACLNPQPDEHPLDRPNGPDGNAAIEGQPGAEAPPALLLPDDQLQVPASTPPAPQGGPSGGGIADAGAPPPDDADGGPGDVVESDAGASD